MYYCKQYLRTSTEVFVDWKKSKLVLWSCLFCQFCDCLHKYDHPGGGYSTLSWVRMCGPKFRPPPYNKTREDANLLPISKPFVSWRALFKTNQCFLQCKLGCISTFWQPIDKPKDKFIGNYAFCKNATYIKTDFQIKKGPLQNLRARKSTLSGPHIPVPTFPLSTPPPGYDHQF